MISDTQRRALKQALRRGIDDGVFPAAACFVAVDGGPVETVWAGSDAARIHEGTRWDLASLTKPLVTAHLVMAAMDAGRIDLDDRVPIGDVSLGVSALLSHRSGLPAWLDFAALLDLRLGRWRPGAAQTIACVREIIAEHAALAVAARPRARGQSHPAVYSDLGFILLGWHVEEIYGRPLRDLVGGYEGVTPAPLPESFSSTGRCPRRERELVGEVNDLNAWVLGGAAGHAGIFATAADTGRWANDLFRRWRGLGVPATSRAAALDPKTIDLFWSPRWRDQSPPGTWLLGWDSPSAGASSAGRLVREDAIGHLGFTGTALWIDRGGARPAARYPNTPEDRGLVMGLLSHRVAYGRSAQARIKTYRPWFFDAVRKTLGPPGPS